MLSRFISRPSNLRLLKTLITSKPHLSNPKPHNPPIPNPTTFTFLSCHFSTNNKDHPTSTSDLWKLSSENDDKDHPTSTTDLWKLSSENEDNIDSVFGEDTGTLEGIVESQGSKAEEDSWLRESKAQDNNDIFKDDAAIESSGARGRNDDDWATSEGYKPWNFVVEDKDEDEVFDIGDGDLEMRGLGGGERGVSKKPEEDLELEKEEKALSAVLQGPNRAFGDLIAASGITDEMLDSLMALKDLDDVQGLPPLREIEDMRYEKNTRKSTRAEIERQKQEEVAKSRVRQVDAKGRAYGTGRRKCSIARVWIQPGDGKFVVNDKQFDVYFPMLDQRAALLRPFSETKTLGLWDVSCTVKGGGYSGQVGAVRLGISKALQSWEPDLRPPLKEAGFLTRDSRVVERKKPGKAKARKSFQWVKR